jgi:hypothetical protein
MATKATQSRKRIRETEIADTDDEYKKTKRRKVSTSSGVKKPAQRPSLRPAYRLRAVRGKGTHMISMRLILPGQIILNEEVLLHVPIPKDELERSDFTNEKEIAHPDTYEEPYENLIQPNERISTHWKITTKAM